MTGAARFLWLYDQLTEQEMTGQQIAVLFILIAREEAGMPAITKCELGALIGVTERYIATLLKELQHKLALIHACKGEKKGRGRAPNRYVVRPDSTGDQIPDDWIMNCKSGTPVQEKNDKNNTDSAFRVESQSSNSGTQVHVICGEVLPPVKEHAYARVEDNLFLSKKLELYPERVELVCETRAMPAGGGNLDPNWVLAPKDRAFANERGFLNGSCDELFGQFLDRCTTHGPRTSVGWGAEWRKWVRNQVKFDNERNARSNQRSTNDQRPDTPHSYASAGKRRSRSVETEILMPDIIGGASERER